MGLLIDIKKELSRKDFSKGMCMKYTHPLSTLQFARITCLCHESRRNRSSTGSEDCIPQCKT